MRDTRLDRLGEWSAKQGRRIKQLEAMLEKMAGALKDLTGYCGNEAFDRSVKRGQAVLEEYQALKKGANP